MSIEKQLRSRSEAKCELCTSDSSLSVYQVPPNSRGQENDSILVCSNCQQQLDGNMELNINHWRCLNDSMWSEVEAVKVVAWRMLNRLRSESWSQDLLEMMYMEDATLEWAKATGEGEADEDKVIHKDCNGVVLQNGDSVVLVQDLKVKGGGFTAKRGTPVRRISLVYDNATQIEGRVGAQQIVLLTQYVKKTN